MNRRAVLLSASLLLSLCALLQAQPDGSARTSYGGQLVMGFLVDRPVAFNPFEVGSTAEKEIHQLVFGYGLAKKPDKITNPPDLISRYLSDPGDSGYRVWHILLDRNVNFHNGDNLRNRDVIFTFRLLQRYGGRILNRQLDFGNIAEIEGNGDLELIFRLRDPDPEFGLKLSDVPIISEDYYAEAMTRGYRVFREKAPMGMGPFRLGSRSDSLLILPYHPHYYSGRPFLDRVEVRLFRDEQRLIDALVNGRVDYIELADRGTARRLYDLLGTKIQVFTVPRPEVEVSMILWNVNRFPLSEAPVRRAIHLAVDRRSMVQSLMKDYGRVATTLIKPSNPYYQRSMFDDRYDPRSALEILEGAGWRVNRQSGLLEKNGRPLAFPLYFTRHSSLEESMARTIKLELGELNIDVQPVPVDGADKEERLRRSDYPAMLYTYVYDPEYLYEAFDAFYREILGAGQPVPNYTNRYLDRLFELTEAGRSPRKNLYERTQMFWQSEKPALFLFFDERIIICLDRRFQDFRSTFQDGNRFYVRMNPIENWFIPKDRQRTP